ncbi:hypothetical protein DPMN_165618 [Dreissena polymorpha]|uniref:Uncharacterized protein n=1 Tax=Dreissena polymorpha TaxID=45954 RepID=A0A9D4EV70_DREPO|nr:hypothetical protein DPMN_165618 [Dreissena polymorpha]
MTKLAHFRAYNRLLDCVAFLFSQEDLICHWNTMRTTLETLAVGAIYLARETVKPCVIGELLYLK